MSIVTPERPVDAAGAPTPPPPRHSWWHVVNGVIALGAVVIGVIALTRDPATKTVEVPAAPRAAATTAANGNWAGAPGPILGIPSENLSEAGRTYQVPDTFLNAVPTAPATPAGGVPSDKYADRVPAYQYDISQQHAPVSPTGPIQPDPSKTIVRR